MAQFLEEVGSFAPRTYAGEIRDNICSKLVESYADDPHNENDQMIETFSANTSN